MLFEPKILVILLFIIINFLIIFAVKTRTTATISLIIAHLILVLFLSISIANYQSFKEIVLALVVYLMVILSLISNHNQSYLNDYKHHKSVSLILILIIPAMLACGATFYLAKSVIPVANLVKEREGLKLNSAIASELPGSSNIVLSNSGALSDKDYKIARLKKKLADNFLIKRASDVILVIAGLVVGLLLARI